jgi:hypothetical protein
MENVWYTEINLGTNPAEGHYDVIGDFNNALFIEQLNSYRPVN